jgi:hypothetical protein
MFRRATELLCKEGAAMGGESKPSAWLGPIPAAVISVIVAALLGLAAGAKVDDLARPSLGPTAAVVAGVGTSLASSFLLVVLSYRGLTR